NRRFVDLVTQRLLKATLAQQAMPYSMAELDAIAQHCTIQEDKASTVERRVLKAAAAYLLQGRIGERFAAIVTGVTYRPKVGPVSASNAAAATVPPHYSRITEAVAASVTG